jgi:4-alpha-glucanotransferase
VHVPADTLRAVLTAMGVTVTDEAEAAAALAQREREPWERLLPPSVVAVQGEGEVALHVADGRDVRVSVTLEDGSQRELVVPDQQASAREVGDRTVWRVTVPLPTDLPLGWHTLHAREVPRAARREGQAMDAGAPNRTASAPLAVTPARLPDPPHRAGRSRGWGLMAQLYSVRSRASWGMGDAADLGDLAATAGQAGADFLLVNPVHAAEVVAPIEPSPYLPATRRFLAPLYVRPEDVREYAYLSDDDRARIAELRAPVAAKDTDPTRIDRDAVWAAKRAALQILHAAPRSAARQAELDAYIASEGQPLQDFALWCALEEHYDGADRPAEARDVRSPLVARLREQLADRVAFHVWLQWLVDDQFRAAQRAARASGMAIGVMHDLAVGVHLLGSDAWSLHDLYARGITVGAPADMYNQQGQDWDQPPWLPDALAAAGYAPLRDMIRTLLRHAGALRIDHIIGFFRLWWIPEGQSAASGTYVRYDHDAMIGVLALEAHRAGAVVIGEDLGNVEPWVRDYLSSRGILGTSVLWFERDDDGGPLAPERYRPSVLATVNTHDLPPTAGYLAGEHVALRARLELLTRPVEDEQADFEAERDRMLAALRERDLIGESATEQEVVEALHAFLTASPSQLLGVALVDAVGERRVQNQPGTHRQYPNWQVPLAGPDGDAVALDDLVSLPRFRALVEVMATRLH